jgi:hypothetical protein
MIIFCKGRASWSKNGTKVKEGGKRRKSDEERRQLEEALLSLSHTCRQMKIRVHEKYIGEIKNKMKIWNW